MPKKLAVLAAMLAVALMTAIPALAQEEETTPGDQYEAAGQAYTVVPEVECEQPVGQEPSPATQDPEQSFQVVEGDNANACLPPQEVNQAGNAQNGVPEAAFDAPASCGSCGLQVVKAAQEAITGGGSGDTSPKETFGAALQAARDAGGTREAAASEEAGAPVEDTAAYRAAFEAAKEAGADDEAAKEAAQQAVAESEETDSGGAATGKTSKASEGGPGEGAAAEGKVRKGKTPKDRAREDDANEEETTEDVDEEVAASADNSGTGGEDVATTPTDSRAPLLLGGVTFLSVGGYAGLRFARSWSSVRGRRLLRN